ncbi:MAG: VWA domain-containing protein [Bacteroidetes bacterium]|nr:MAG: VWA domain-containing protein [Bacteroidota bacterium]REK08188.1 MAG: VWA domain-containing protein [Bacteroidota bacterium]REK32393.1 MAG: VWA domain-containing protein [Bacteroidota bacterium]REK49616.1 MAG: VWA domain-containing protein [Bacteroidota bacterium]
MTGHRFSKFIPTNEGQSAFDRLFKIFLELLNYTSGDVPEALSWLTELDKEYKLTDKDYTLDDFINDLKKKGYLKDDLQTGKMLMTAKTEQSMRKNAFDQLFGRIKKSAQGNHRTVFTGTGDELSGDRRAYMFGDSTDQIDMTESIRNAQIHHGTEDFRLYEEDLEIVEREHKAQTSTVLMIDISHSMILYGEDRITPAKKVAMALAELIQTRYPKDTLDILVFGDDAQPIEVRDIPFLQVGPYHTNTVAGLELAMNLLRRRKNPNKQIFMITDGKPSCMKQGEHLYKNSFGLDRMIVNRCLNLARTCRKMKIGINTFMLAEDNYLRSFIREFSEANGGKAFYTGLNLLGEFILEDFEKNRKKKI